jgi:guanylate kinase
MGSQRIDGSEDSETSSESASSQSSAERPLVVISGPSGVGKSTILKRLADDIEYVFSVSATTREPRPGEVDGVDYHFVKRSEFERMISDGEFVEHAEYGGNLYGTPIASIEAAREDGKVVVLDIELEGARQVRKLFPDALFFWIRPPSFEELEHRLISRHDTPPEAVRKRLERARIDNELAASIFDIELVNDDVDRVSRRIHELVSARFHSVPLD